MNSSRVGAGTIVNKAILAENVTVGEHCELGIREEVPNEMRADIYGFGLVTIGENSIIPDNVKVGKNTAISGETTADEYPNGILESGKVIIKAGDR